MARDLFQTDVGTTIPKSDPKVERIEFEENQIGARKSHLNKVKANRNIYNIRHVEKG